MVARFRVLVATAGAATALLIGVAPPVFADPDADPPPPGEFAIASGVPTLAELDAQIRLLVGTPALDAVRRALSTTPSRPTPRRSNGSSPP